MAKNRYGEADPEFPDPTPASEQIPANPYLVFFNLFGTKRHVTKRQFLLFLALNALIYGAGVLSLYAQGMLDAISTVVIFLAALAIPLGAIWFIGRYNASGIEW